MQLECEYEYEDCNKLESCVINLKIGDKDVMIEIGKSRRKEIGHTVPTTSRDVCPVSPGGCSYDLFCLPNVPLEQSLVLTHPALHLHLRLLAPPPPAYTVVYTTLLIAIVTLYSIFSSVAYQPLLRTNPFTLHHIEVERSLYCQHRLVGSMNVLIPSIGHPISASA